MSGYYQSSNSLTSHILFFPLLCIWVKGAVSAGQNRGFAGHFRGFAGLPACQLGGCLALFLSFYISIFLYFYLSIFLSFYISIFLHFRGFVWLVADRSMSRLSVANPKGLTLHI